MPDTQFKLRDLDFGSSLTANAQTRLRKIDEVTRDLDISEWDVVACWFAAIAHVSTVYYPAWDPRERNVFGRGVGTVAEKLHRIVTNSAGERGDVREAVISALVRSSAKKSPKNKK